jgi:hypothetical protein
MSLRPGGVTGIAILFLLGAIGAIIAGIVLLADPLILKTFYDGTIGPLIGGLPLIPTTLDINWVIWLSYALIPVGVIFIVTGLGLIKLQKWGYWLAILISIPLIVTLLGIIFIWYLRKDEVKAAFDIM